MNQENMRPNIFTIATKELHQDAFIAWLLKWADPSNAHYDTRLTQCGQQFIRKLCGFPDSYVIKKVDADRQWENIDVWAEINDEWLLIVEDKTYTGEHSNQLIKYKSTAENYCNEKGLKLVCVYLKTGAEASISLKHIENKGYAVFTRKDILEVLNVFKDITNNIFSDFRERLILMEDAYRSFENKVLKEWDENSWVGFYQSLEKQMHNIRWKKVNNQSGGFWNAVISEWYYLHSPETESQYALYLQIEQGNLCFKICTDPEEVDFDEAKVSRKRLREQVYNQILKVAKEKNFINICRPDRFGNGKFMTVALVYKEQWLGRNNQIIDKITVIQALEKYKEFLAHFKDEMDILTTQ